jgi:hypothetical protein
MSDPRVIKRLARLEKTRKKVIQNALNEQALKAVITRSELEASLAGILKSGESESARVSAGMAIARINGWILHKPDHITERLKGKSDDELEFIALNGRDPANAEELRLFTESRRRSNAGRTPLQ